MHYIARVVYTNYTIILYNPRLENAPRDHHENRARFLCSSSAVLICTLKNTGVYTYTYAEE